MCNGAEAGLEPMIYESQLQCSADSTTVPPVSDLSAYYHRTFELIISVAVCHHGETVYIEISLECPVCLRGHIFYGLWYKIGEGHVCCMACDIECCTVSQQQLSLHYMPKHLRS